MRDMPTRAALVALIAIAFAGCRDVGEVYRLTRALNEEFAGTKLGVSLTNGTILTVTAADARLAQASCETQVAFALRVGRFLQRHDADLGSLQAVNVAFVTDPQRRGTAAPHLPIRFSPNALSAGSQAQDSATALASCLAFEELNPRR